MGRFQTAGTAAHSSATIEAQISDAQYHLGGKLANILDKYGPGPRVHYHIGLFGPERLDTTVDITLLKHRIVAAQEALIARAAQVWDADAVLRGEIVDVGTGLGGGAIYWAQHHAAIVHALTNVASHIPLIDRFAAAAGVEGRVRPILADAREIPTSLSVDAAVAMESMCYMPREDVISRLGGIVRPGGWLCIQDVFLQRPEWGTAFDAYWKTSIGTANEYVDAARRAGFALDRNEDVTAETTEFWVQSMAWAEARIMTLPPDAAERERLAQSVRWHANFFRAWLDGGIQVRILRFRKTDLGPHSHGRAPQ
ncbi:SAM-dependent methyltransferase [Streptomyces sp. NPDC101227]|uniref:SAM-dependent methyltransferase n=1 Tax=Streptomyces sp. NPDC101227 TaxID=3366136 RepID=UPI00382644B8